jgi:hypothetical protein
MALGAIACCFLSVGVASYLVWHSKTGQTLISLLVGVSASMLLAATGLLAAGMAMSRRWRSDSSLVALIVNVAWSAVVCWWLYRISS